MTKEFVIDTRSQRMLELLAQGAGSKLIAKELGYQDGTMRVYLHNLYRKIGVANKTEAVIWYLKRGGTSERAAEPAAAPLRRGDDLVGDMALADGLFATLGVMGQYLGPWGRVWEMGVRLSGESADADPDGRHARSRALWNALMKADFAYGKAIYDVDEGYAMLSGSASDAVLLAGLLVAGGYSHAARQLASKLTDRRRSRPTVPAREAALLDVAFEAFEGKLPAPGLSRLQKVAEGSTSPNARQLAMVMLFHAARARRDPERARLAANAIWAEAEGARKDLQAMGDSALTPSKAGATAAKAGAREKAAVRLDGREPDGGRITATRR
jgi:DNA-binding CsgD family transcriptional regulator